MASTMITVADDQPKVDGADGQEIGDSPQHQRHDRKNRRTGW
jgi:hypothetical protein